MFLLWPWNWFLPWAKYTSCKCQI